jgi:protein SCO1/2
VSRIALAIMLAMVVRTTASAEPDRPPPLRGVGVEEHVGLRIPLDLTFNDAAGKRVQLGELFDDGKPVLMVLAYMRCKMLCSLVLHATTEAVKKLPLELGRDYRVITVGIDPTEDAASAAAKRDELLARAGHPGEAAHWTYLVGADRPIHALADSLGFRYAWDPRTEQYAHPAVVFVLSPDGTISRYLQGVQLDPDEVARALRAAAAGQRSTSSIAETVLSCFHYDPAARAHRKAIDRYLQVGGTVIMLLLGGTVVGLFLWERRRRRQP